MASFEGVCEHVFGSTFTLQSYPEYLHFFRRCAVPWVPDFFHAPIDQGSPSRPPQHVGPASRSLGAVSPVSPPPSTGLLSPGGASVVRTRYGRLSTAPRHLRPSEALSTSRGASRRRPHLWRLLPHRFRRRSRAAPGWRGSARTEPRQNVLPARPVGGAGRHMGLAAFCARASPSLSPAGGPCL